MNVNGLWVSEFLMLSSKLKQAFKVEGKKKNWNYLYDSVAGCYMFASYSDGSFPFGIKLIR